MDRDPPAILPWAWIVEALADFKQADTGILQALLGRAPGVMCSSFKNARERVSLRLLEEWVDAKFDETVKELAIYAPPSPGLNFAIDICEPSEDVLIKVADFARLGKFNSEMKYDLEQYLLNKRASLPASALDEMKDSFDKVCHPSSFPVRKTASLAKENGTYCLECSRTSLCDCHKDKSGTISRVTSMSTEIQTSKKGLTVKILENAHATSVEGASTENEVHKNYKKKSTKHNKKRTTNNIQPLKDKSIEKSSSPSLRQLGGSVLDEAHSLYRGYDCAEKCGKNESAERHTIVCNGSTSNLCEKNADSYNPGIGIGPLTVKEAASAENALETDEQRNVEENIQPANPTLMPPFTRGKLPDEVPATADVACYHQGTSREFQNDGCSDAIPETSNSDRYSNEDTKFHLSDHLVAAEKQKLLTSQNHQADDFLASDWTQQRLCMKCGEGGEILICCASECVLAVHAGCLGSSLTFDGTGKFYCPFCSYIRAHAAYRGAKKTLALSRKELTAFIGRDIADGCRRKAIEATDPSKQSEARAMAEADFPTQEVGHQHTVKNAENHLSIRSNQCMERGNEDFPCRLPEVPSCETVPLVLARDKNDISATEVEGGQENQSTRISEHHCQPEVLAEPEISPTRDHVLVDQGLDKVEVTGCHQSNSDKDNTKCAKGTNQSNNTSFQEDPCIPMKMEVEVDGFDGRPSSSKMVKRRLPTKRYTNPILPCGRRNKLLWTAQEEEILKWDWQCGLCHLPCSEPLFFNGAQSFCTL